MANRLSLFDWPPLGYTISFGQSFLPLCLARLRCHASERKTLTGTLVL
jgi:hypothetical protein